MYGNTFYRGMVGRAYDGAHIPVVDEERTNNLQVTAKPFPFLELPAEIRNKIYRLVLLTQNVSTYIPTAHHSSPTLIGIIEIVIASDQPHEEAVGTVQCESWRTYTLGYQVAILRANRQIYREALGIFQLENFWTFVSVNKTGFGKEMKDLGFPIATGANIWRFFRFSVMNVTVIFPSLEHHHPSDTLLIATLHLKQLIRALWTAKGASEMKVTINVQRPLIKNSPDEGFLLRPFLKLRSINQVIVMGIPDREHVDQLTRAMTTDCMNQVVGELTAGVKCLQQYIEAKQWEQAVAQANEHSMFVADCKMAYGNGLSETVPRASWLTAFVRKCISIEITIAMAMARAEVSLYLQKHTDAIRFANRALKIIEEFHKYLSGVFAIPSLNMVMPVHPRPNHLFLYTGTLASERETKCIIHMILARAHIGMQQALLASINIEQAREFMPTSRTLPDLSEAWRAMFGPFSSPPTPTV